MTASHKDETTHTKTRLHLFTFMHLAMLLCFYPKRLTVHSGYTFFVSMCVSLGIEPTTLSC